MKKSWRSLTLALAVALTATLLSLGQHAQAAQLVLFEGSWCPTCRHWNKTVGQTYAKNEVGRLVPLRRVDVNSDRPADLAKPNVKTIYAVPTFVVMEQGHEIGRIEGFISETYFWKKLNKILSSQKLASSK